jgi:hypothetical protein
MACFTIASHWHGDRALQQHLCEDKTYKLRAHLEEDRLEDLYLTLPFQEVFNPAGALFLLTLE